MASIKDLKKRIGTVKNTQQTTKAMKMVSAAKLRRAQDAITAQRPYAKRVASLMQLLARLPDLQVDSPLVAGRASGDGARGGKLMLVLVSSDRGLCGGFNSNVIKTAQRWIKVNGGKYESITLSFVGKKAYDFFKIRKVEMGEYYQELGGKVTFAKAKKLADSLVAKFMSGEVDEVKFVYNEFKNAVSQVVQVEDFLPIGSISGGSEAGDGSDDMANFIVKPDPKALFEALLSKHFSIQAFRVLLESQASEHGARMSAMENATNNASDMIWQLTLDYNKQRQASITKELLEIISGSESQKAG